VFEDADAPEVIIYEGPAKYGQTSSTINLWPDGRFRIGQIAAVDEAFIMNKLTTRVLFVCTGNTCRSPLAEGLARDWERKRTPNGLTIEVGSAGVAAGPGSPASEQTIEVLKERGIDLTLHHARMLTPEMVDEADVIYTMTPAHAQAVMQIAPDSAHKVFPIDPLNPIADPIGHPIEVYRQVADQLETLIDARLKEFIDE
jgi:protein-tyrosine-phosphatase